MTHLTLDGVYAGYPLCGCNKESERAAGNDFAHAVYAPKAWFTQEGKICPECLKLWNEAE